MDNFVIIAILILVLGAGLFYIVKEKKSGAKCVGCPYAKQCGSRCNGSCNHNEVNKDK